MAADNLNQFTTVDEAADPEYLVQVMDTVQSFAGVAQCRQTALAGLRLGPGQRVLELGCGTGEVAIEMAGLVSPGGSVVGIDVSEVMVNESRQRAAGNGLPVEFEIGDAQQLRFADATFDACRTERMLVHVPDARAAIGEMARVLRPGGRVAVVDVDFEGTALDHPDRDLTRAIITGLNDSFCNGWIGRQLPRLFGEAGLTDVSVKVLTLHWDLAIAQKIFAPQVELMASSGDPPDGLAQWMDALVKADASGTLYFSMPFSVVTGVKP